MCSDRLGIEKPREVSDECCCCVCVSVFVRFGPQQSERLKMEESLTFANEKVISSK